MSASQLSLTQQGEFVDLTGCNPAPRQIELIGIPPQMLYHRIFCYVEAHRNDVGPNLSDYFVEATVQLWKGQEAVSDLPACIGQNLNNTLPGPSLMNVFPLLAWNTAAHQNILLSPAEETLFVLLSSKWAGSFDSVVLGCAKVIGLIDRITFGSKNCDAAGASINKFRVFLAIRSTVNPF